MTEKSCLIDTDILSYILKKQEPVYKHSLKYFKRNKGLTISCITYYECFRGYKAIGVTRRLEVFKELLRCTEVLYLDQVILEVAPHLIVVDVFFNILCQSMRLLRFARNDKKTACLLSLRGTKCRSNLLLNLKLLYNFHLLMYKHD
jgi:hypothetical protein